MTVDRKIPLALSLLALLGTAPVPPAFGVTLHIAPDGSDANDGSHDRPFATPERARDALRAARAERPTGAAAVILRGGLYRMTNTLTLAREDSGDARAVVTWRAASREQPVFNGGVRLAHFTAVSNAAVRDLLPTRSRDRVLQADLRAAGVGEIPPLVLGGFAGARGFRTHSAPELFFNGKAMPRAGWPDDGFATVTTVSTNEPVTAHGATGTRIGRLGFDDPRLLCWTREPELWAHGYWFWDWADSYERVARVDPAQHVFELEPPLSRYGFRAGQSFRVINAFSELDQPGEWVIDRARGLLLFLPPADVRTAVVELTLVRGPLFLLDQVAHVRLEGLTWELGAGDGVHVHESSHVLIAGCTVRNGGGNGIEVRGGASNTVRSCAVYAMGRGGLVVDGGDRRTLSPGGHRVENCRLSDFSRVDRTYTPAVAVRGVGQVVVHNHIHDLPSSALSVSGNDHLVAWNEIERVVRESDDQGAVDMNRDPTFRGNRYLHNYFHDIGSVWNGGGADKPWQAAIRLDDAISGVTIAGNIFERCGAGMNGFGAVQIHGGKDNLVESNLFVRCDVAVSYSPWPEARWLKHVAGRMERGDLDAAVHLARRPELARLEENPNVNELRGNLVVNGALHCRAPAVLRQTNNVVITNTAPLADLLRLPGAPAVPLRMIGLQRDRWYADRASSAPFAVAEKFQSLEAPPADSPILGNPPPGVVP